MKIVSDGNAMNTKIYDDDGKEIKGATELKISVLPNQPVKAMLSFDNVKLEVIAEEGHF
jgi:hypothetical protein